MVVDRDRGVDWSWSMFTTRLNNFVKYVCMWKSCVMQPTEATVSVDIEGTHKKGQNSTRMWHMSVIVWNAYQNESYWMSHHIIQLTNWILWNGQFYYRDVIKMTITRAKGEGNGHFYHIEVIDLPFHTIPFVSCFISLIENTKKWTFIENLQVNLA